MINILKIVIYIIAIIMMSAIISLAITPIKVIADYEEKVEFVAPELRTICAAESTGDWNSEPRHYDKNGNVLLGWVNNKDIGQCQINIDIWGKTAHLLGYDLRDFNDNIRMANWIYIRHGNGPWYLSRSMWDKI